MYFAKLFHRFSKIRHCKAKMYVRPTFAKILMVYTVNMCNAIGQLCAWILDSCSRKANNMALNEASAGSQQQLVPGGSGKAREQRPETRQLASPLPVVSAVTMSEQTCRSLFKSSCPLVYPALP